MIPDLFHEWQDICQQRHRQNKESNQAFQAKIKPTLKERQRQVLEEISLSGSDGLTCKELANKWAIGMNVISGRFSELKRSGQIEPAGNPRNGSKPYKIKIDELPKH